MLMNNDKKGVSVIIARLMGKKGEGKYDEKSEDEKKGDYSYGMEDAVRKIIDCAETGDAEGCNKALTDWHDLAHMDDDEDNPGHEYNDDSY